MRGEEYETEIFILDKLEFFTQIVTTPKETILSQKVWTIIQRPRLKGRDFFDIIYLLQNTNPDLSFLKSKFGDKKDVKPFLFSQEDAKNI